MKNTLCARTFVSLFFLAEITLFSCSPQRTAGGSEIGNPTNAKVIGTVVYPGGGGYVAGADVRLRPKTFCKDTTLAALSKAAASNANTMTDDKGRFVLDSVDTGSYSIEVNDGKSHAALISCSVSGADTVQTLPVDTARPTSLLFGTIMAAKNGNAVYVQIFGIDRVARANPGTGQFLVADVPQGNYDLRILSTSPGIVSYTENNVSVESGSGASIGVVDLTSFGGWSHSRTLSLNTTATGADVAVNIMQFPLLVRLTRVNFNFGEASADGADLRFAKPDGRFLPYEIERFDSASQMAEVWVTVDTVRGNDSAQSFIMYYGNPQVPGGSESAAVFDTAAGFQGVWHMNENPEAGANAIKDRTVNVHHGTANGSMSGSDAVSGMIGKALSFNGQDAYVSAGVLNLTGSYALSCWVNSNDLGSARRFIWKEFSYTLWYDAIGAGIRVEHFTNAGIWRGIYEDSGHLWPLSTGVWYYLVGTYDGDKIRYYVNGIAKDSTQTIGVNPNSSDQILSLGGRPGELVSGTMDEVRIENIARSSDWIKLCYMNQKSDDRLVVVKK
jgi:hypothetical protein